MEFIRKDNIRILQKSGIASHQLIFPENSASERVTVTRVLVQPGFRNERHRHEHAEQIWIALSGQGELLLKDNETHLFGAGDVVRFADGEVHGLQNVSGADFEYLAITAPPVNFRYAYQDER